MNYIEEISKLIKIEGIGEEEIASLLTVPPERDLGDYALPCFRFAKALRKPPVKIAEELAAEIAGAPFLKDVRAVNGYLNFFIDRNDFTQNTLREILSAGVSYGESGEGAGRTICIDYSSINIAKPFHIGHLSTTVIGGALVNIYRKLGYRVVGINHLGDWGTQFGKLISAYKRWGSHEEVEKGSVREMLRLYVKFHDEAEKDESLNDEARAYFKRIEDGDEECLALFNWFKELTIREVQKIYDLLGVKFDSYAGESFYNDKMQPVVDELEKKGLLKTSEGAKVVDLEAYGMPPCLILKADGATLYATRDLAAAFYRKKTYDFAKCLYVVAYQQNLHFQQVFKVLELMGCEWAKDMVHVAFGMVSLEDSGSLSTRRGNVVFLEDVLKQAIAKAKEIMLEKTPDMKDPDETAKRIGVGAVIFSTLSANRIKDIVFSFDKVLNFDGETGPYVQYAYARCSSVLEKAKPELEKMRFENLSPYETDLVNLLGTFPKTVKSAAEKYEPSYVTRLMAEVAKSFNKFYFECRIIGEEEGVMHRRLGICAAARSVLASGLGLLNIQTVEKM